MKLPTSTVSWKYYTSVNKLKLYIGQLLLSIVFWGIYMINNSYNPKGGNIYVYKETGIITLVLAITFFVLFIKNIIKNRKKQHNESSIK